MNLGVEKLAGIRIINQGANDVGKVRFQNLVSGNLGDTASEVWTDIELTATFDPPAADAGYASEQLALADAEIANGKEILFPRARAAYVGPVVRLACASAPTTTAFTAQLITDPHS